MSAHTAMTTNIIQSLNAEDYSFHLENIFQSIYMPGIDLEELFTRLHAMVIERQHEQSHAVLADIHATQEIVVLQSLIGLVQSVIIAKEGS